MIESGVVTRGRGGCYNGPMLRTLYALPLLLPAFAGDDKLVTPGLHNVHRITDKLLSGSRPEGDEGFRLLRDLGVKTVMSVDGARPEVERARKYGLRYVHLPFGYDGPPREQVWRVA